MRPLLRCVDLALCLCTFVSCATPTRAPKMEPAPRGPTQKGIASWYGGEFKRTASGERYDPWSLTAAHRKLPFGTRVRVTSVRTQRSVIVRINNRGPYARGRIIDVSKGAASKLGMLGSGIAKVELEVLPAAPAKPKRAE